MHTFCRFPSVRQFNDAPPEAGQRFTGRVWLPGSYDRTPGQDCNLQFIATPLSVVSVFSSEPTWFMDYLTANKELGELLECGQRIELRNLNFPDGEFDRMLPAEIESMADARFPPERELDPGHRQDFIDLAMLGQELKSVEVQIIDVYGATTGRRRTDEQPRILLGASSRCGVMKVRFTPQYNSLTALAYLFGTEATVRGTCGDTSLHRQ